jgi:hypothetical protein
MKTKFFTIAAILLGLTLAAHAADELGNGSGASMDDNTDSAPAAEAPKVSHSKSTRKVSPGEKETDGTTAANRFEADTVIKSQYKLNGEQLEVDPD